MGIRNFTTASEADYAKGVCTPAFRSEKWRMMGDKTPSQTDRYYSFKQGNVVRFLALDTQPMVVETWQDTPSYPKGKPSPDQKGRQQTYVKDQQTFFVDTVLQPMETLWHIAFGHHPYISNGPHGNAGNYDNLSCPTSLKTEDKERKDNPRLSPGWQCGLQMRDFMESLCAQELDLYLSGHDHSLQWLSKDCGSRKVEFIVSGAGAGGDKLTTVKDKNQDPAVDVRFTPAGKTPGFVYLVVNDTQIDVQLVDASTPETPRCIKRGTLTKTARGAPVRFAENTCM